MQIDTAGTDWARFKALVTEQFIVTKSMEGELYFNLNLTINSHLLYLFPLSLPLFQHALSHIYCMLTATK